jgi:peptidoglycan/xylan/chitin deacetylase (PgdA/CDA1 family)
LFRPPFGFHPPFLLEAAQRRELLVVGWSISPHDSFGLSGEKLARRVIARAHSGDIILLHDGRGDRQATVEALPLILDGLAAKGLKCVTVPELLSDQVSMLSATASPKVDELSAAFVKSSDNSRP